MPNRMGIGILFNGTMFRSWLKTAATEQAALSSSRGIFSSTSRQGANVGHTPSTFFALCPPPPAPRSLLPAPGHLPSGQ